MQLQPASNFRPGEKWEENPDWEWIVALDNGGFDWAENLIRPGAVTMAVFRRQLDTTYSHHDDYHAALSLAHRWPGGSEDEEPAAVTAHGIDMAELNRERRLFGADLQIRILIRTDTKAEVAYAVLVNGWPDFGLGERQGELTGEVADLRWRQRELIGEVADAVLASVHE